MNFPFFKKKPAALPTADSTPPLAKRVIDRTLELCAAGKLEWSQATPKDLNHNPKHHTGYVATYKNLRLVVIPTGRTTILELHNPHHVVAWSYPIQDVELQKTLQDAVWENSIAKEFLGNFLDEAA